MPAVEPPNRTRNDRTKYTIPAVRGSPQWENLVDLIKLRRQLGAERNEYPRHGRKLEGHLRCSAEAEPHPDYGEKRFNDRQRLPSTHAWSITQLRPSSVQARESPARPSRTSSGGLHTRSPGSGSKVLAVEELHAGHQQIHTAVVEPLHDAKGLSIECRLS